MMAARRSIRDRSSASRSTDTVSDASRRASNGGHPATRQVLRTKVLLQRFKDVMFRTVNTIRSEEFGIKSIRIHQAENSMRVNIMSVYSDHRSERLLEVIGFADRVPCRNADCGISSCASPA